MSVDQVRRVAGRVAVIGAVEGEFEPGPVRAEVAAPTRRQTERNHTATHLLHAALRRVLGDHVFQQGSLVAPDRLRFDFSHTGPMSAAEIAEVERLVNEAILANTDVCPEQMGYREAMERGAMALFSEKYADVVRVIDIPGVSMELCGGTHVRTTGQIGLFRILSESGVAAGVRRIEAITGEQAVERTAGDRATIAAIAEALRTREENVIDRARQLVEENRELQRQLTRARAEGGTDEVGRLLASASDSNGVKVVAALVSAESIDEIRALGDRLREQLGSGVAVLAGEVGGKASLFAVATDDLIQRGVRADVVVREVATAVGGRGGGRPHMAQAGIPEAGRLEEALAAVAPVVERLIGPTS